MRRIIIQNSVFMTRLIIALLASLVMTSCDKDGDMPSAEANMIKVNSEQIPLSSVALLDFGNVGSAVNCDLAITSQGVIYDVMGNEVNGSGIFLYFEMMTSQNGGLASGTYHFNTSSGQPGTFTSSSYMADLRSFNPQKVRATDGTIKVENKGSAYSIQFSCKFDNGTVVSGGYEGIVAYYQSSGY